MSKSYLPAGSTKKIVDIDSHYELTDEQIASFRSRGFVKLKDVLSPEVLDHFGAEFTKLVHANNTQKRPMSERNTYQQAFIQIGNLWQRSEVVKRFVFGKFSRKCQTTGLRIVYTESANFNRPSI